ncbi:MAG TPA: sigma-54 dependent transcriptional regulator [Polyangiaceae bacterium]|nr:sigma-54 dependent transcriptional regulator [Polyangiaceae bacterium]
MKDRILIVDDDQGQCDLLAMVLERHGYEPISTTSPRTALERVAKEEFDAVITDLEMTEMGGLELCERMLGTSPNVPIVVVTGQGSMDAAIKAMRVGAYDFLTKPVDSKVLGLSVARAVQHRKLNSEVKRLREAAGSPPPEGFVVGSSTAMKRLADLVSRVSQSDASVLIHGETGTGKELVAKAIHGASPRKGPFVAINCAAVPANLLESELFGHARGAFTDAKNPRQGLFVEATGGTLFLDEIGEMPLEMQAKLLRALQERRVRPLGSNVEVEFDARIVCATHRDLEAEVEKRRFREDLYYRVNVVKIDVPPLRERGADILQLASFFLRKFSARSSKGNLSLSPQAAERMLSYDWPGNVRELENAMERAVALARLDQIVVEDLPDKIRSYRADRFVVSADDPQEVVSLEEIERRYIYRVIKILGGNKARAAELLGLDRRTLYRRLEKYEGKTNGKHASSRAPGAPDSGPTETGESE